MGTVLNEDTLPHCPVLAAVWQMLIRSNLHRTHCNDRALGLCPFFPSRRIWKHVWKLFLVGHTGAEKSKGLFSLCFSVCTPSLTLLSAFSFMNHKIIEVGEDVWDHQIQPLTGTTVLNMQLLCIGKLRAPAAQQFATEGLFSGPQLNRIPGDGATGWTGRIRNAKTHGIHPVQPKRRQHTREILTLTKSMVNCSYCIRILPLFFFFSCMELSNLLCQEWWLGLFCKT